jgi:hypothetical protein
VFLHDQSRCVHHWLASSAQMRVCTRVQENAQALPQREAEDDQHPAPAPALKRSAWPMQLEARCLPGPLAEADRFDDAPSYALKGSAAHERGEHSVRAPAAARAPRGDRGGGWRGPGPRPARLACPARRGRATATHPARGGAQSSCWGGWDQTDILG